jgi:nucleoid DNA-binding protein
MILPINCFIHFEYLLDASDENLNIYLKNELKIGDDELERMILNFTETVQKDLEQNGTLVWEGIGRFDLTANNQVQFIAEKEQDVYLSPIQYEHVIRETYSHNVLTGDKVQTSDELHTYFEEQRNRGALDTWKIASLIILTASVVLIIARFMIGSFSIFEERQNKLNASEQASTYILKK